MPSDASGKRTELKTQLKGRERPKWLAQASRDLNRNTPLIVR